MSVALPVISAFGHAAIARAIGDKFTLAILTKEKSIKLTVYSTVVSSSSAPSFEGFKGFKLRYVQPVIRVSFSEWSKLTASLNFPHIDFIAMEKKIWDLSLHRTL